MSSIIDIEKQLLESSVASCAYFTHSAPYRCLALAGYLASLWERAWEVESVPSASVFDYWTWSRSSQSPLSNDAISRLNRCE